MRAILEIVFLVINIYMNVIIASAVLSWLIAFNVVNVRNDVVRAIWTTLTALTEPLLAPIRRALPNMGGVDISPVALYLLLLLVEKLLTYYVWPNVF